MGGNKRWSKPELAVLFFFLSRGVRHKACAKIVSRKCESNRTYVGVRSYLWKVKEPDTASVNDEDLSHLWDSDDGQGDGLNIQRVDQWILSQQIPGIRTLISFDAEEEKMVDQVIPLLSPWSVN